MIRPSERLRGVPEEPGEMPNEDQERIVPVSDEGKTPRQDAPLPPAEVVERILREQQRKNDRGNN